MNDMIVEEESPGNNKPKKVRIAISLMWLSIIMSLASSIILTWLNPDFMPNVGGRIFSFLFGLAIVMIIMLAISNRKNWARIVWGVGTVISALAYMLALYNFIQNEMPVLYFELISGGVNNLLSITILYLLYSDESNQWFKVDRKPSS